jgi:hypothetical protein
MIRAVICMSLPLQEFAHLLRCYYRLQEIKYMGHWGALHNVRTYFMDDYQLISKLKRDRGDNIISMNQFPPPLFC